MVAKEADDNESTDQKKSHNTSGYERHILTAKRQASHTAIMLAKKATLKDTETSASKGPRSGVVSVAGIVRLPG